MKMCKNVANWIMTILFALINSARADNEVNATLTFQKLINSNQTTQLPFLVDYLTSTLFNFTPTESTNENLTQPLTINTTSMVTNEFTMLNTNDSMVHPWLPIGNFTNILNQSYILDTFTEPKVNAYQIESQNVLSVYKVIDETEASNKSDNINREGNLDESLPSFFDDSPTKDEDYAGGAYGNDEDNDEESDDELANGNLRSNFISREDEGDKLT
ncbi:uncharacterized protein LOC107370631 [Tetranychus urticae]|uniref:Uncharacterized protein n=1 Tax=Tetranychus urticae TaxID=32264 RepID=T1KG83_TETUR|nr:uncharacterized protein LOC107370631 [Tetranychus urticae]